MVIEFFMAMVPPTVTHQEKQVHVVKGKPVFYEPADLKAARQKLMGHLAGHRPEQPFDQGVRLMVKWCFPKGNMQTVNTRSQSQIQTISRSF